jgi:hypothetical protein
MDMYLESENEENNDIILMIMMIMMLLLNDCEALKRIKIIFTRYVCTVMI